VQTFTIFICALLLSCTTGVAPSIQSAEPDAAAASRASAHCSDLALLASGAAVTAAAAAAVPRIVGLHGSSPSGLAYGTDGAFGDGDEAMAGARV